MKKSIVLSILLLSILLLVACAGPTAEPETDAQPGDTAPEQGDDATTSSEMAPEGASAPPGYDGQRWADIVAEARGQSVNLYMWGGQENINRWVTGEVATALQEQHAITLNQVPLADTVEAVNKVLGEVEAGREAGSVDMIWINGENFATLRQADLLYGPFAQFLPNARYVDREDPSVIFDLGLPTEDYESPWGKAQFVIIYDSERLPEPPTSIDSLVEWVKANPGQFTYPAPPDFTGVGFVLQMCYHATGGHEQFLGEFDQALFDEQMPACWALLNEIEPFLWREGETYPETHAAQQNLYANGEVTFDMAWNPAEASSLVEAGRFPESTRTFVFDEGSISNTHYVTIPSNSSNKAAAMVVANYLLSPEAQHAKADVANWGDFPAVVVERLPEPWPARFSDLPRGVATLPNEVLSRKRLPELPAAWRIAIEEGWQEEVLKK